MRLGLAAARTGVRALPAHDGRAGSPLHAVPRNDLRQDKRRQGRRSASPTKGVDNVNEMPQWLRGVAIELEGPLLTPPQGVCFF